MKMLLLTATLGLLAIHGQASVVLIAGGGPGGSVEGLGYFTGSLSYVASSATAAKLTVQLSNTTQTASPGRLTAFAFNEPNVTGANITSTSLTTRPNTDWDPFGSSNTADTINASPYGRFDLGAGTGSNFLDGSYSTALARGNSATFVFTFSGTGLNLLSTASFTSTLNKRNQFFAARFEGFDDCEEDLVVAQVVPEPGAYGAIAAGAVALLAWRKRQKQ